LSPQIFFISRDKTRNTGRITCRVCLEDFQTTINFLSEAVDVYNDWIDACETANWLMQIMHHNQSRWADWKYLNI